MLDDPYNRTAKRMSFLFCLRFTAARFQLYGHTPSTEITALDRRPVEYTHVVFFLTGEIPYANAAESVDEAGNAAAKAGTLGTTIEKILADLKPEATYFFADDNGTGLVPSCSI
jgi:hypothetical protein